MTATARTVEEWIGATPDTPVPDRVKLRVFDRHNGVCHIAKRKIWSSDKWDVDHIVALINGGENRESNLAPVLVSKHKEKTARDVAEKSRTYRKRKANLGIKKPRTITRWRKFNNEIVIAPRER